jgi:hypothetical protein
MLLLPRSALLSVVNISSNVGHLIQATVLPLHSERQSEMCYNIRLWAQGIIF